MRQPILFFGIALVAISLLAMAFAGKVSGTAFIPAALGAVALFSLRLNLLRRIVTCVVVAVLGLAGSAPALPGFFAYVGGESIERPAAVIARTATVLVCAAFLVMAYGPLSKARKAKSLV
jgi:hypothetical protein